MTAVTFGLPQPMGSMAAPGVELQRLRAHREHPAAEPTPVTLPGPANRSAASPGSPLAKPSRSGLWGERFPCRNAFTVSGLNIGAERAGSVVSRPYELQERLFIFNLLYLHAGRNYFSQTGFNK